jgi:hypothetical protein
MTEPYAAHDASEIEIWKRKKNKKNADRVNTTGMD